MYPCICIPIEEGPRRHGDRIDPPRPHRYVPKRFTVSEFYPRGVNASRLLLLPGPRQPTPVAASRRREVFFKLKPNTTHRVQLQATVPPLLIGCYWLDVASLVFVSRADGCGGWASFPQLVAYGGGGGEGGLLLGTGVTLWPTRGQVRVVEFTLSHG